MSLSCVAWIPTEPLQVDQTWLRESCAGAPWAEALESVVVEPLAANGGGLTGATISKLRCTYDPPGAGPETLILKLSDEESMREFKANGGPLGGGRSGRNRPYSRGAYISRMTNWSFGLTEHDMSLNEALFYGQWREQLVGQGCRAPEIHAVCVSMPGLPTAGEEGEGEGGFMPRNTPAVLLARRRHPNFVPFVLADRATGLRVAVVMEDLLADPEATIAYPQFGLTAAIADPNAPRVELPEARLLAVMRAMGRLHAQGWGVVENGAEVPYSPWCNHMVFGLHPVFKNDRLPIKKRFGDPRAFRRVLSLMAEWGEGLGDNTAVYRDPRVPEMLSALHATFSGWEHTLCDRKSTTLIHGDMHLGNMVFDAADTDAEPVLLDWQFFGAGDPALDLAYFFLMSLAPDPPLEARLLSAYIDSLHAAGVSDKLLDLEGLTERVDALMIEAVVHFTSIRVFGEGTGDRTYELGNMMRKLESGTDSEQDATTVRRHDTVPPRLHSPIHT